MCSHISLSRLDLPLPANCTRLSTFETDLGDWIVVSSINTTWQRSVVLKDHTRLSSARRGYTINAFSWNGKAGTTRIDTDRKFMEPIYNFQTPPCVEIAAESNTTLGDNFQTTHRSEISAEYSTTLGGNNHILKKVTKDKNICNEYESVSTKRTSVEHVYESDTIHINQYEPLTNQRELDKHTYESTEQALLQSMKTSIEQDENTCNRYESLSTNRNSAEHIYESDTIPINHYQSLKQQKGLDEHTYESTEHALTVLVNQELSQYEPLTIPSESDKHTYESTEHASQVSMKQEGSQYESLTNPPESDKHVYASTKSPR
ncbi:Hypothetical predicted protein [Mytilus galloprovincialis]|uniref:Uncharacterized protein n=1 Tax=Mytilus galloprovincialis TaxID=29158 RepID=A0A8B6HGQ6_MYTGA|nr:Hypothetical predicted protein [Mytilus galloprovincialis]